jgi:hypothetical protein
MKYLFIFLAFALWPFAGYAQTPGAQPEFCVTSPSQTANYNQTCISASSSGGMIGVTNFGSATGGLNVGTITGGTWNGNPITNTFISTPFTTINGTTCNLGSVCTVSAPTSGIVLGTSTITGGTTNQIIYDNGGVFGEITKGNSCVYGTSSGGVPSCLTTLPSTLTLPGLISSSASIAGLTVTSSFTATGLVTNADLASPTVTVNTVACTLGSSCTISASASLVVGSTTVSTGTTNQILYDNGGTLGEIAKGNSCVYGTNGTGVPSCITTLPFVASLATGGTNANLTASTGGILYSGASAVAILAGTATANLPLLSGSSAAPTWATVSYPASANSGGIPYFSSSTVMASSNALGANCIVYGGGTGTSPATSASGCPTVSNAGAVALNNTLTMNGNTVFGGSAANSILFLESTSNGSPSGDILVVRGSLIDFQNLTGATTYLSFTSALANIQTTLMEFGGGSPTHIAATQTTPPAVTSCGTGSPSISGTDTAGIVTMGTSAAGCTITFNVAYSAAPYCVVTWIATPLASQSYVTSASAITLTQTATSGNKAQYHCIAQSGG